MNPYTDNPELDALVRERMETLPAGLRRLFDDAASVIYIENFAATVGLTEDQAQQLQYEIMLLILGFTPREDFSFVLMTELDMPPRQAFAVEHWVATVFLKDVFELIGTSVPGGAIAEASAQRAPFPDIPEALPLSGALLPPEVTYRQVPATAPLEETMSHPMQAVHVPAPAPQVPYSAPAPVVAYVPPVQPTAEAPVYVSAPTPAPVPVAPVPAQMPASTLPVAPVVDPQVPSMPQVVYIVQQQPAPAPALVVPQQVPQPPAPAPVAQPVTPVQSVVQVSAPQPVPATPVQQVAPVAPPVLPVPPKPIPLPVQPVAIPHPSAPAAVTHAVPQVVPVRVVSIAPPPLPVVSTPIPAPPQMLTPPVPRIATGAPVDLNKAVSKPRTIFQDIAAARGAISPEGVARYDKPFAQAPAYGVPQAT